MDSRRLMSSLLLAAGALVALPVAAQTTAGGGTVVVLPSVAYIPGAYTTTVFVRNPNATPITLNLDYRPSLDASGPGTCQQLTVGGLLSVQFDLSSKCTFPGSNNFGTLILTDVTGTYKTNAFIAYSRAQTDNGNGFSVEGFPIGNFSGASADAIGLKKTSTAPHYRSNCFVTALGEAVDYQIILRQGETGALLGNPISGTLNAFEGRRYLDVFAAAGLAGATYSNVRAQFVNNQNSSMIGFCTVETSDNGSADFRIAKSIEADDNRQSRLTCYGMDSCGANVPSVSGPAQITNLANRNIHYLIVDQPDYLKCDLVAADATTLGKLQIKLRGPGSPTSTGAWTPGNVPQVGINNPPYLNATAGSTYFYVYTGEKSTIAGGTTTRWYIDVSVRNGVSATAPVNYGIKCTAGNGLTVPWLGTTAAKG